MEHDAPIPYASGNEVSPVTNPRDERQLEAARSLLAELAAQIDSRISVRLWDGSLVPMGHKVEPDLAISISGPGVLGSMLRRPTPDNLVRHYARGQIDFHGTDLYSFIDTARVGNSRKRAKSVRKSAVARALLPFLLTPPDSSDVDHRWSGDETGKDRKQSDNKNFIQFHYDVSNEFYALFLDPSMVYSCGYFREWEGSLEQAQTDKIDMICRKLRLQPDDRLLDIGCGWGALVMHAAQRYGVSAHGITLSENQLARAKSEIKRLGLESRVTVELRDYADVTGEYDKISSIGMCEHVGIDNMAGYMRKVGSLLRDRGVFLNHAITRPGKESMTKFRKVRPERRLVQKYIFPGGELDHIGHMTTALEASGFEVHDIEGWREHYARTTMLWCQRLSASREEAIRLVGEEKYRMWILYLAGVSFAFRDGSIRIFQTVATRHASKGASTMPPTREHLYAAPQSAAATDPTKA